MSEPAELVKRCEGCDPSAPPGTDYHLRECPYWRSLPPFLAQTELA